MRRVFLLTACFALVATLCAAPVVAVEPAAAPASPDKQKLIETLRSDAPPQDKAAACKQLAVCGGPEAVAALAPLLADDHLAAWARIALEAIPGPAANEALRQSLDKLQGRLLIGAINSIGRRADPQAVDGLIKGLTNSDAEVASAAAAALGRIDDPSAAKALEQFLPSAPTGVRSAVAEGCMLGAERKLAGGKPDEALRIYELLRTSDLPKQRILEATRGVILARQAAGLPLLVEQLQSADKALFNLALQMTRELAGPEVTAALVAELGRAAPQRRPLVILALADRGDAKVLPVLLDAVRSGDPAVRAMAIRTLKRLGDASCVPLLLEIAAGGDEDLAQAAVETLADLPGQAIDEDLMARLPKAEGKSRLTVIQLLGERAVAAAAAGLLKAVDDPDAQVRTAAVTALGAVVESKDLPVLIAQVARPTENADDATAATAALRVASQRMPDREACAAQIAAAVTAAATPAKCRLLDVLGALGGAKALETVGAAAKAADPDLQDAASRLLGEWMSVDAAPVLLDLAKTAADPKYEVRAMRGYIRVARQFAMPDAERVAMCRTAMEAAKRDAEKKLALDALKTHPSIEGLRFTVEAAKVPALKGTAAGAAQVIARKLEGHAAEVQKLFAELGLQPMKVEIIKAQYGAGEKQKDVTDVLRKQAAGFPLIVLPAPNYNKSFGGDPAPSTPKELKIQYRIDGKPGEVTLRENAQVLLPVPK